ncbi:MAG: lytic transglycosylase domain-containing protein [Proteobacteria bacterium]|nr:lytic transglycosylase domain-containing protein [Pseudomonadota bacterium]
MNGRVGQWALVCTATFFVTTVTISAHEAKAQGAGLYRYIDAEGGVHFTNLPTSRRFRPVYHTPQGLREGHRPQIEGVPTQPRYDPLIERVSQAYRVEPALVKAVIAAESNFDPRAVSRAGARGLMQLMPQTARELGVEDPHHAGENVWGGVRYLRSMLDRYGDVTRALAAYNAGPTAVDRYRGVPPYRETEQYVARVLHYYRHYHGDFQ